ncbi:MAG: signal transduction histidine kinase regulating citrate/malate metabolism [Firmicutes bacterium]|nr:signal transduction histidine kinase regulating citrate/malate metabolism [Bacillota bacterium]
MKADCFRKYTFQIEGGALLNFRLKYKLQTKIILLVFAVVVVALLPTNALISRSITAEIKDGIGRQATSVAHLMARSSIVIDGLTKEESIAAMQIYANESADAADVEYIVILNMQGVRKAHPDSTKIGEHFVGGDEADALAGREYISVARGTLGDSLRAFVPVITPNGEQVGVVVVGILMDDIQVLVREVGKVLLAATVLGMIVGIIGAFMLSHNIKKTLFGLEPEAIAKRLEERNAMLQSVHEGIIAVDKQGIITLVNDEALRMLNSVGLYDNPIDKPVQAYVPNTRLMEIIKSGNVELNQEQDFHGVSVLTNRLPMMINGKIIGAISTFRDKTEVKMLAEQLTGVRDYVDALRAQAHEFMNKLHVILGLVKLESYDQLATYINRIVSEHEAEVNFVAKRIREPVLAGFILSKLSLAREKNVVMHLAEESDVPQPKQEQIIHELVTIIGNLVENAFDAVRNTAHKEVELHMYCDEGFLCIHVSDTGAGILPEISENLFIKGISSKGNNRGFGLYLVQRSLEELQGNIEFETRPGEGTVFTVTVPYEIKEDQDD